MRTYLAPYVVFLVLMAVVSSLFLSTGFIVFPYFDSIGYTRTFWTILCTEIGLWFFYKLLTYRD